MPTIIKAGYLDFYPDNFASKRLPAFPTYTPIPEHAAMGKDDLVLTRYKTSVHAQSRTAHVIETIIPCTVAVYHSLGRKCFFSAVGAVRKAPRQMP